MEILGYSINYFDVLIVALLLLFTIVGACRGLLMSILKFIRLVIGVFASFFISNEYAVPIYDRWIRDAVFNAVSEKLANFSSPQDFINSISSNGDLIEKLMCLIPSIDEITQLKTDDIAAYITDNILHQTMISGIKIILFVAVFALFLLISGFILIAIKRKEKKDRKNKTKLSRANRFAGGVLGLLKGSILVLMLVSAVSFVDCNFPDYNGRFFESALSSQLYDIILGINPFNVFTEELL